MHPLFAHHRVEDVAVWRRAATEGIEKEKRTGERGIAKAEVYQTVDGEAAIMQLTFRDLESARAHEARLHAQESKPRLEAIGVVLPATVWIAQAT